MGIKSNITHKTHDMQCRHRLHSSNYLSSTCITSKMANLETENIFGLAKVCVLDLVQLEDDLQVILYF